MQRGVIALPYALEFPKVITNIAVAPLLPTPLEHHCSLEGMSYAAETHSGVVTSWIPLTTVYTPSQACSQYFRLEVPSLVAFDPGYGTINPAVNCQPSAVTTWWEQGVFGGSASDHTAVSILPMTCPYGWSTAVSSISDDVSTLAMCCPSGYNLMNQVSGSVNGDCQSSVTKGHVLTYALNPGADTNVWSTSTITATAATYVGAIAIVGWNIDWVGLAVATTTPSSTQTSSLTASATSNIASIASSTAGPTSSAVINYITTTTSSAPTANDSTSTTSATTTSTAPATTPSTSSATLTSSSPSQTTSTSTIPLAAKIGIGLGASLGLIGIIALLVALWLMRKKRTSSRTSPASDLHSDPDYEMTYDETNKVHELYGNPNVYSRHFGRPQELSSESYAREMAALHSPVEMPGTRRSRA